MARRLRGRLTPQTVERATRRGLYSDGGGLCLQVAKGGSKSWIFRYRLGARIRAMGLGGIADVRLSEARDRADDCRRLLRDGIDPLKARDDRRSADRLQEARSITFDECAGAYIAKNQAAWRNAKHRSEWAKTLQRYASPIFGKLSVQDIDVGLVVRALDGIWLTLPETAARVRGRIETVLDFAKAQGYRTGENPAALKGNLGHILPSQKAVKRVKHHAAMPHADVAELMAQLATRHEIGAAALAFAILTAARSGEVIGAQWGEIDLDGRLWTVPATRMKSGREHKVPLSDAALELLEKMQARRVSALVFPGVKKGQGIAPNSLSVALRRCGHHDATVHGFRSSFRDWTSERTSFPREIAEAALAHVVGDKVEAAYRRTEFLEKRAKLMAQWGRDVSTPSTDGAGKVVAIGRGK